MKQKRPSFRRSFYENTSKCTAKCTQAILVAVVCVVTNTKFRKNSKKLLTNDLVCGIIYMLRKRHIMLVWLNGRAADL